MACAYPLLAVAGLPNPANDYKRSIKILNVKTHESANEILRRDYGDGYSVMELPCGQCMSCRLEYSRQWAMRCVLEAKYYFHNYWLTLTYDDKNVPLNDCPVVDDNGELIDFRKSQTLVPDHLSTFIKDLRRQCEYHYNHVGVRFYACGEYGGLTHRPHYHVCLFNMPDISDRFGAIHRSRSGDPYYDCEWLDKIWNRGLTALCDLNYRNAAYTARYMTKKHKGRDADWYDKLHIYPEFTRSSRMPGIGRQYLDDHPEIYDFDRIVYRAGDGGRDGRPPRYYDRIFGTDNGYRLSEIKQHRAEVAINATRKRNECIDIHSHDSLYSDSAIYNQIVERKNLEVNKNLTRPLDRLIENKS